MPNTNLDDLVVDDLYVNDLTFLKEGWNDLRVDAWQASPGSIAPTDENGFRGNSAFRARNFVHTQADEIQFEVQMDHDWKEGTPIGPHFHFSPWIANEGAAAAKFILETYIAKPFGTFPESPTTYPMTYSWSGDKQWGHLIAGGDDYLDMTGMTISTVLKCRLYRDNTVANNFQGKLTMLYFDIHYVMDTSKGSDQEYIK